MDKSALVILSGGQDSTTCLGKAKQEFKDVYTITFDYGQRHSIEVEKAEQIAKELGSAGHETIELGEILKGTSPLISDNIVGQYDSVEELPEGVEPTFVAGRNILFLTIAGNRAHVLGTEHIFTGVCQEDFAGYWDCRQQFIDEMAKALSEGLYGTKSTIKIHTPLMDLTKKDSVILGKNIFKENFDSVFKLTHTCYNGLEGGCGKCHACILRDRGFIEAGMVDPIWELRENK
jgi:7-cyano-7-deazaguanine synthase|tara:strand:+ start:875 stop:1573 length:699 start_codon:yes stop_codon:yes gene_type:complete